MQTLWLLYVQRMSTVAVGSRATMEIIVRIVKMFHYKVDVLRDIGNMSGAQSRKSDDVRGTVVVVCLDLHD